MRSIFYTILDFNHKFTLQRTFVVVYDQRRLLLARVVKFQRFIRHKRINLLKTFQILNFAFYFRSLFWDFIWKVILWPILLRYDFFLFDFFVLTLLGLLVRTLVRIVTKHVAGGVATHLRNALSILVLVLLILRWVWSPGVASQLINIQVSILSSSFFNFFTVCLVFLQQIFLSLLGYI